MRLTPILNLSVLLKSLKPDFYWLDANGDKVKVFMSIDELRLLYELTLIRLKVKVS